MSTPGADCDEFVVEMCRRVSERMNGTGLACTELRERKHLDPFMKDAIEKATGRAPSSMVLESPAFPGLGAVDVLSEQPRFLMELKWSYEPPGKVFESVWDAIKLAILGPERGYDQLYVVTGACDEEWGRTESADLFEDGMLDPLELWRRPLNPPRGPNSGTTVGEDLVIGARENQPKEVPERIAVRLLAAFPAGKGGTLKLVGVTPEGARRAWPPTVVESSPKGRVDTEPSRGDDRPGGDCGELQDAARALSSPTASCPRLLRSTEKGQARDVDAPVGHGHGYCGIYLRMEDPGVIFWLYRCAAGSPYARPGATGDEVAICAWKPRSPTRAQATLAGRGAGLRERVDNGGLRLLRAWSAAPELRGPMAGSALAEWVRGTVG